MDAGLDEKRLLGPPPIAAEVRLVAVAMVLGGGGPKRSLTWLATTIAQSYSRASLRRSAPSRMSCADRVASAAGVEVDVDFSAR